MYFDRKSILANENIQFFLPHSTNNISLSYAKKQKNKVHKTDTNLIVLCRWWFLWFFLFHRVMHSVWLVPQLFHLSYCRLFYPLPPANTWNSSSGTLRIRQTSWVFEKFRPYGTHDLHRLRTRKKSIIYKIPKHVQGKTKC